jgi:hypothetical protein
MKSTSRNSITGPLVLAAALLAGTGAAGATTPPVKGPAEKGATAKAAPTDKPAAAVRPGVTTGDDDDINDLEVQRKAKPARLKPGQPDRQEKPKAAVRPGVTTGDDDDINDLEVQRKAKAVRFKPGKELPSKSAVDDRP